MALAVEIRHEPDLICPTPNKGRFESRAEALKWHAAEANDRRSNGQHRVVPYLCACGDWHFTSGNRASKRRQGRRYRR